jgi:hypothetical protein
MPAVNVPDSVVVKPPVITVVDSACAPARIDKETISAVKHESK